MSAASTPLPREVEAVLCWWLPRLRSRLGPDLACVLLGGGLALGGFEPGWSDVDVCVVVERAVDAGQEGALRVLHAEAEARFVAGGAEGWRSTQLLEGVYVGRDLLARADARGAFLTVGTGTCRPGRGDPVRGFDRHVLAHHGIVLAGGPVPVEPPSRAELARATAWLPGLLGRPAADHSPVMLAGLLQEAARSLVFWRDGVYLDKTRALEREIRRGGEDADAFRLALDVRRTGSRGAASRREALAAAYGRRAASLRRRIASLLGPGGPSGPADAPAPYGREPGL